MDLKETIAICLRYIEENLYKKFSLDDIAMHCGMSKYHLHRMFKSLTGESLMEYVQSRKLSSSISELKDTSRRIIDIAMDYGFDYEQSYI
ncbi:MAG: transcriptional regulator with only domain, AraC family, partial [Firmicutes bacterium]|nr:transcriptional regulator with only domain, AraC family [Bacillota bacterium]